MEKIYQFEWDKGNIDKNWINHKVSNVECEEIFFNSPFLLEEDLIHFQNEKRYYILGRTNNNRLLFISFTVREQKIRIISARDMSKKERRIYNAKENNSEI
jgi:hypothetical protein